MACQVAGIERRAQAAPRQRLRDRLEHRLSGDADVGGRVPSDQGVEIGDRRLQKRVVVIRDQPGAGGKTAPEADRSRRAVAALDDSPARRT